MLCTLRFFYLLSSTPIAIEYIVIGFRTLGSSTRSFNVTRLCHVVIVVHYPALGLPCHEYFSLCWRILSVLLCCFVNLSLSYPSFFLIVSPCLFKRQPFIKHLQTTAEKHLHSIHQYYEFQVSTAVMDFWTCSVCSYVNSILQGICDSCQHTKCDSCEGIDIP